MRLLATALLTTALVAAAPAARADALTSVETDRLLRGETVVRSQELDRGARHYVGGVSYQVLDAAPGDLEAIVDDVATWRRFLPKAREVQRVGALEGDDLVEFTHGSTLLSVGYTMRFHRDGNVLRFWVDRSRAHDIDDAWGYLRAEPLPDGRTLLTWGILIDMGPGLLRNLFESKVQAMALTVPARVRDVLAERAARGERAAR